MPRPSWLSNPWALNPWFETVAVAQSRAKKRLPSSVYGALSPDPSAACPPTTTPPPSPSSASPRTSSATSPSAT